MALTDATKRCNTIYVSSYKFQRIVRPVMDAEVYEFVDGFEYAYVLKHDIDELSANDYHS